MHKMIMKNRLAVLLTWVGFSLALLLSIHAVAHSQAGLAWPPPQRIPEYRDETMPPVMIADQNKTVYAFASQWVGDEEQQLAILFREWTRTGGWSLPIDILLDPSPTREAQVYDAFLDDEGIVHIIFRGGESRSARVYYSRAPIDQADRAPAWSTPVMVGGGASVPSSGRIVGDGQGNLVIIYNGYWDGSGVYALYSADGGQNWSSPTPIFLTFGAGLTPFSLQLVVDEDGRGHATWNVVTSTGVDQTLHYARVDLDTKEWTEPVLLDQRAEREGFFGPSFPSIASSGQTVVIMFNGGKPNDGIVAAGRPVQRMIVSNDGGDTWEPSVNPYPLLQGRSGTHALATDAAGVVHALFLQRIDPGDAGNATTIGGIWHSSLTPGENWTEPVLFELGNMSGHDLSAVMSQGNTLLVAFREDPGRGVTGVWYSYAMLNAPELPLATLPAAVQQNQVAGSPTPSPVIPTPMPEPAVPPQLASASQEQTTAADVDPTRPLLLSLVPVLLFITIVIGIRRTYFKR